MSEEYKRRNTLLREYLDKLKMSDPDEACYDYNERARGFDKGYDSRQPEVDELKATQDKLVEALTEIKELGFMGRQTALDEILSDREKARKYFRDIQMRAQEALAQATKGGVE